MRRLIFFTTLMYFSSFRLAAFEVKNFSNEDSSTVQAFSKYLIDNEIIKFDSSICLVLLNFQDRISHPIHLDVNSFNHVKLIDFKNDLEFSIVEKFTKLELFTGFVIRDRIVFNTISYLKYAMPSFDMSFMQRHFEEIKSGFPKLKKLRLDSDNFGIINKRGKVKGTINLIYKSKASTGCFFAETSYIVDINHYSEFNDHGVFGFEPVFIYLSDHPKKYFKKGVFIGIEYYMFDSNHQLIHHGINSESLIR